MRRRGAGRVEETAPFLTAEDADPRAETVERRHRALTERRPEAAPGRYGRPRSPPRFDETADRRECRPGADPETEGLDALDRDRAASLADEGGAAGAIVEARRATRSQPQRAVNPIAVALTVTAGALTALVAWRLLRR